MSWTLYYAHNDNNSIELCKVLEDYPSLILNTKFVNVIDKENCVVPDHVEGVPCIEHNNTLYNGEEAFQFINSKQNGLIKSRVKRLKPVHLQYKHNYVEKDVSTIIDKAPPRRVSNKRTTNLSAHKIRELEKKFFNNKPT